ncbi:unnamed protein product [Brassica oleracea]
MEELPSITVSQREQFLVENDVFRMYSYFDTSDIATQKFMVEIQRDKQLDYLMNGLRQLGPSFSSLDANRPWVCYWIIHSIALLGESVDDDLENNAIDFLGRCQGSDGGYGGGPGQLPHLATSYAAVNTLVTLGGEKAFSSINREQMACFLRRMKDTNGGFRMHNMGEIDVRACYTAISIASILNIVDDELTRGLGDYILSCQTYEGGIGGEPGSEAHGGYTYCGLATMILINEVDRLNLDSLMNWIVHRQGVEMGFQGRTTNWSTVATRFGRQPLVFYYSDFFHPRIWHLMDHHICHKGQMKITRNMLMMKMILKTVMKMILMRIAMKIQGMVTKFIIRLPTLTGEFNLFLIASACKDMCSCALRSLMVDSETS